METSVLEKKDGRQKKE